MNKLSTKEFVNLVSKRPGMYIFSEGITELNGLLRGYAYSRDEDDDILKSFSEWLISEKYPNFEDYNISWCKILLFNYSSEKRALDKFFEHWAEFTK